MKTSVTAVACMLFLILLSAVSCGSQQAEKTETPVPENSIVGVWKVAEVTITGPNAQTVTDPMPGICILTKKYMSFIGANAPRPDLPEDATDAQIAAAFKPLTAVVASYETDGNVFTAHPIVGKDPNMKPDDFLKAEYKLEGDYLFVTPKENQKGPIENPVTMKFIRIE